MRKELLYYLNTRPDLKYFIRERPEWYRTLSRNPAAMAELEEQAKVFFGKTFGQRVDRFHQQIKSIGLLMDLLGAAGENNDFNPGA
ncbi:YlbE-like family protein [Fictibacillus aquaticus]|uniref:YlbE-like protein n=1 Tax=Fictibacillus aquaticus TaxID=2021314 RepID=A0A235FCM3_9BACL|nr:YlbE-like family protein [Fictibacillus aquaticus]OYD58972.1 hypothetical protein CGZ90_03460 [Fictibacillus aquaticus]